VLVLNLLAVGTLRLVAFLHVDLNLLGHDNIIAFGLLYGNLDIVAHLSRYITDLLGPHSGAHTVLYRPTLLLVDVFAGLVRHIMAFLSPDILAMALGMVAVGRGWLVTTTFMPFVVGNFKAR